VQYPVRSPIDNPLFSHGAGNPGRTLMIFAQQIVNYAQYFNWQWGRALGPGAVFATALFAVLGAVGFTELYRRERAIFVLLGAIWLVTGFGLVVYMNFKPGYSLFWGQYPSWTQHEVRERDYFFTVSFLAWALASGVGLVPVARSVAEQFGTNLRATAAITATNMVRGALPLTILLFKWLRVSNGYIKGGWLTGIIIISITLIAAIMAEETFGKDLNYVEV